MTDRQFDLLVFAVIILFGCAVVWLGFHYPQLLPVEPW